MKPIARSAGRSAVAAAAYRSAECLVNQRDGLVHDYRAKGGVAYSEIVLPAGVEAEWALDRSRLWNAAEQVETRRNARTADEFEIALPHELTEAQRIALVQEFAHGLADRYGAVVDFSLHEPQSNSDIRNHHAHMLMSTRQVSAEGFGEKIELEWRNARLLEAGLPTAPMQIRDVRATFAEISNRHLALAGHDLRIDHRSHADRGLTVEPTHHMGVHASQMDRRGQEVERVRLEREAAERNRDLLLRDPTDALRLVTEERSVFTRHDVAAVLHRYLPSDELVFRNAFAVAMASPELCELQPARKGERGAELARYSTREMLALEQGLAAGAERMVETCRHGVDPVHVAQAMERQSAAIRARTGDASAGLSVEQRAAIAHVTGAPQISAAVGFAGSGKSTMLEAAREAWEAQGYRVHGAALSGKAAEGLEQSSGIASRTLASWEMSWSQGRSELGPSDVLVIDEAGMVGSRQMAGFIEEAERRGAKLVLVGDHEQLQAIGAGAPFRAVIERVGFAELAEIRRQRESWQCEASRQFATHRTAEALAAFERHGAVQFAPDGRAARAALVATYLCDRSERPEATQVAMAHRRVDVEAINAGIRDGLQVAGLLARGEGDNVRGDRPDLNGREQRYETVNGSRAFAPGDRIVMLENNRALGVKNGMLGTVTAVEPDAIQVRLDGRGLDGESRPPLTLPTTGYRSFDHGYATTIHKTQGATVDRAYVLASSTMDRHLTYVAMTRHRDGVGLYASQAEFKDFAALQARLGRDGSKEMTLDYGPERQAPSERQASTERMALKDFAERRGIAEAFGVRSSLEIALEQAWAPREEATQALTAPAPRFEPPRFARQGGLEAERPLSGFQPPRFGQAPAPGAERSAPSPDAAPPVPVAAPQVELFKAIDRWARAQDVVRPALQRGLEPLAGDARALRDAGAALDRLEPGTQERLLSALRYDGPTQAALEDLRGYDRIQALHAGLDRETQARLDPQTQSDRFLLAWRALDAREEAITRGLGGGRDGTEAREVLEAERIELARTVAPGSALEQGLRERWSELGMSRERLSERPLAETLVETLEHRIDRGREIDLGYGL